MRHIPRKSAFGILGLVVAAMLSVLVNQNCGQPMSSREIASNSELSEQNTEGGNGDIYDGKLYVLPGPCEKSSSVLASGSSIILSHAKAVIAFNQDHSSPKLMRDQCRDLTTPRELAAADIQWLGPEKNRLKYADNVFWFLELVDLKVDNVFRLSVNTHTNKLNLRKLADESGWRAGQPLHVSIESGVVVYSDSVEQVAFDVSGFPAGTELVLHVLGAIHGARRAVKADKSPNRSWEGGLALALSVPTFLIVEGAIIGGAGQGGDEDMDACCSVGNGGSYGGTGGSAIRLGAELSASNLGRIYGGGGGGASGGGAWAANRASGRGGHGAGSFLLDVYDLEKGLPGVSDGGDGGDFGRRGQDGGDAGNGKGFGGDGGYAIELNGHRAFVSGAQLVGSESYESGIWTSSFKGRIKP